MEHNKQLDNLDENEVSKLITEFENTSKIYLKHETKKNTEISDIEKKLILLRRKIIKSALIIANNYFGKKDFTKAFTYYQTVLKYQPDNAYAFLNISDCLKYYQNYELAIYCLTEAQKLLPDCIDIQRRIGDIYHLDMHNSKAAIPYYTNFVKKAPKSKVLGHVYNILGDIYNKINKYRNINLQIEYFENAIKYLPESISVWKNLAAVYPFTGEYQKAIYYFKKVLEKENTPENYCYYASLLLALKNFEEGWKYYEYRLDAIFAKDKYTDFNKPKWNGEEISDKTLLICYEQGYGDTIQFCRYIEQVKPLAKKIIFYVQDSLKELMELNIKDVDIIEQITPDIQFDYYIPIISLMHILNTNINNIPFVEKYIQADKNKIKKYKKRFFNNKNFKIGIAWSGNKNGNRSRDIPLRNFYTLAQIPNSKIYSFQKGNECAQLQKVPKDIGIIDIGSECKDFSDTAAAMSCLDIFITSDNVLVNLAGAMGVKTLLMLNKCSEWRWFSDENTTPWYKSVKIIKKQNESNNWNLILHQAKNYVEKNAAEKF